MPPAKPQNNPNAPKPPTLLVKTRSPIFKKLFLILLTLFILGVAGVGAFYQFVWKKGGWGQLKKTTASPGASVDKLQTAATLKSNLPRFADFMEEAVTVSPKIPNYTIETGKLENLSALEQVLGKKFNQNQLKALTDSGFFLTPVENKLSDGEKTLDFSHGGAIDEFLLNYKTIGGDFSPTSRKPENAVFITSDLLLHSFHVFLDRTFQYVEETQFQPKLLALTDIMLEESLAQYQKATDPKLKASFERLSAFFAVPKVILETSQGKTDQFFTNPNDEEKSSKSDTEVDKPEKILARLDLYEDKLSPAAWQKAKQEIELINEANNKAISPLFGEFKVGQFDDYSQYKPRSHYGKNSLLRSYWKAMIWYGRNGFLTKSDELTYDAINQTIILTSAEKNGQKALTLWENIYLPTVFFVGKSDDLTIYDYRDLINKIYGAGASFDQFSNIEKFNQFKEEVKKLAEPGIQSSIVLVQPGKTTKEEALSQTKSFRFMGQRFIPDSFIFSTLTQGDEAADPETGQSLPAIPTALMPMNIFGSLQAKTYLQDWVSKNAPNSDKVIAKVSQKLTGEFAKLDTKDWTQNLYWSWLYTLKSLFQTFGQGYPAFMQTKAWNDKDLNASLGSWTELRHDTLLYAKQSYAELGGGPGEEEIPPVPKGYVEPNLQFLNRIIALTQMTKDGLGKNNVLPEEQKTKIDNLLTSFKFYRDFAQKALENQKISDDEFEKLRVSALELNSSLTPPNGSSMKAAEARAGLIADVHTAPTEILYEATGIPKIIFVAVKDANGTRLTRGVVYSYYEFTRPFGERLSDADWQANIYEGKKDFPTPQVPDWVKTLEK